MLRFALLVLLIVNMGYAAWSQGWMATLGWAPQQQSESYRFQQQVRPEVLRIASVAVPVASGAAPAASAAAPSALETASGTAPSGEAASQPLAAADLPTTATASTETPLPEPTVCLQTEYMDMAQLQNLQSALQRNDFPASAWEVLTMNITGRWMVYLGKFANETALEKRRAELRNRQIGYDRAGGNLEPGLSLGRFSTEEAATRELGNMLKQGVRGARVVQERAGQTLHALRFARVSAAQQVRLQGLQTALHGKSLRACAAP